MDNSLNKSLGQIIKVDVRKVWTKEDTDFTPWLANEENIALLGKAIGLELEIEQVEAVFEPEDFALQVLSREFREPTVHLKDSPVIVAGGGGVTSPAEFKLIEELAHVLGGEVGASRAAVDAGLISREHQVGQTGTTVRPRLYIAAGISGAIQHSSGMDESNKIIAINTDPNAPIFNIAHYKIVGDLGEVLPILIQTLREKAK